MAKTLYISTTQISNLYNTPRVAYAASDRNIKWIKSSR